MSNSYDLDIEISKADPDKLQEILGVLYDAWYFDDLERDVEIEDNDTLIRAFGRHEIPADIDVQTFGDDLIQRLWAANGAHCPIYLELVPLGETIVFDHRQREGL